MSERTTAELIAELRSVYGVTRSGACAKAADRLEELDAEIKQIDAQFTDCFNDLRALDVLRPVCPTCGGTTIIGKDLMSIDCPDCADGRVPFERLVARWNAVQNLSPGTRIQAVLDAERSIK